MALPHLSTLTHLISTHRSALLIGAGISVALASTPAQKRLVTWKGFLAALAQTVRDMLDLSEEWERQVMELVEEGALDRAAAMVESFVDMGGTGGKDPYTRYHHLVFKILHTLRAEKNSKLATALHRLRCPIFTTNYDVLLEDATGRFTLSIDDVLRAQRQYRLFPNVHPLSQHQQYIFHLHGLYYDHFPVRNFILTEREYAESIDDFLMALKPLLVDTGTLDAGGAPIHRSMIFIGVGGTLQDIHFASLFAALHEHNIYLKYHKKTTIQHYVLLTESEATHILNFTFKDSLGADVPATELLVPVVYGIDHDDLPKYLGRLVQELEEIGHAIPLGDEVGDLETMHSPMIKINGMRTPIRVSSPNPRVRFHGSSVVFKDSLDSPGLTPVRESASGDK